LELIRAMEVVTNERDKLKELKGGNQKESKKLEL
jgi:hypothetical protein